MKLAQIDFGQLYQEIGQSGGDIDFSTLTLGELITTLLPYIFALGGLALLVYLLYGGLTLMLSRGDPKAAAAARERITYALIGFIIIFLAFWIVQIIVRILGIQGATQGIFG